MNELNEEYSEIELTEEEKAAYAAEARETARLEREEAKTIRLKLNHDIQIGKGLKQLRVHPAFKAIFLELFLANGKQILWENIKHLTEEQMKGRGSDRNLNVLEELRNQVGTRVDFEGFLDTIENDYKNAIEDLEEIEREEEETAAQLQAAALEGGDNA